MFEDCVLLSQVELKVVLTLSFCTNLSLISVLHFTTLARVKNIVFVWKKKQLKIVTGLNVLFLGDKDHVLKRSHRELSTGSAR